MTGLRIGWATPWNERSAIATAAGDIGLELLKRGHEITVLRTEAAGGASMPPRPGPFAVFHMDELDDEALRRRFDVVVAHIGNHHLYHGALIPRLSSVGIVGIFHDLFLGHLAAGHFEHIGQPMGVWDMARKLYGPEGMPDGDPYWTDLGMMVQQRPMLEWLSHQCLGAVAHAEHYFERLRSSCSGPASIIPLSYISPEMPPPPVTWNGITIAAIGHANPNKRIDQIIMAIGSSPLLRQKCRLRIIGEAPASEKMRLEALSRALKIEPPEFTGWINDESLGWKLRDVDVVACLRNPVLEGASASVIVALSSGRPTLVTSHGCYAEIPTDAALHCRPHAEALDVMRHLESFLLDPAKAARTGVSGRNVAFSRHSPSSYADSLTPLLEKVSADRHRFEVQRRLALDLRSWGLNNNDLAAVRIALQLGAMELTS